MGIIPGQGDGVDPSVYVGPHDTGVPIIKGIYTGKNAESISQMDTEYFVNVYTKGITAKRGGTV